MFSCTAPVFAVLFQPPLPCAVKRKSKLLHQLKIVRQRELLVRQDIDDEVISCRNVVLQEPKRLAQLPLDGMARNRIAHLAPDAQPQSRVLKPVGQCKDYQWSLPPTNLCVVHTLVVTAAPDPVPLAKMQRLVGSDGVSHKDAPW